MEVLSTGVAGNYNGALQVVYIGSRYILAIIYIYICSCSIDEID